MSYMILTSDLHALPELQLYCNAIQVEQCKQSVTSYLKHCCVPYHCVMELCDYIRDNMDQIQVDKVCIMT